MAKSKDQKKKESKGRDSLKTTVIKLYGAQQELSEAAGYLEIQQALFDQKNQGLIKRVEAAKLAVQLNDETLRNILVAKHTESGEVAFGPGLDIRMRQVVSEVDPEITRNWALEEALVLLEVDKDKFKRMTEAGLVPEHIASMVDQPTPYITKTLSKTIEGMGWK